MGDSGKKNPTYEPMPEVPREVEERYQLVIAVQAGILTVTAAAERLGLSRNRFQTIMHRGIAAMLEALAQQPGGRPRKPEREAELEAEVERLRRENERLQMRTEMIDRMLEVAGGIVRGQIRTKSPKRKKTGDDTSEDGICDERRAGAAIMRGLGITAAIAAALVGAGAATVRRWNARRKRGEPLSRKRGPGPKSPPARELIDRVSGFVREMRGMPGVESVRRAIGGISRRAVAVIKRATLTRMEVERKQDLERVRITMPGIVRGFDQMEVGDNYLLVAADGSIPYRTKIAAVDRYDGANVARVLDEDFRENGAPLVLRNDRARCHETPDVREVLRAHRVLLVHGPPRCARYYGQLERQNREHREWLGGREIPSLDDLQDEANRMRNALNAKWVRRTLEWRTASERWWERPMIDVDRDALRDEVTEQEARLRRAMVDRGAQVELLAPRLAIEQVLAKRGWLVRELEGWC